MIGRRPLGVIRRVLLTRLPGPSGRLRLRTLMAGIAVLALLLGARLEVERRHRRRVDARTALLMHERSILAHRRRADRLDAEARELAEVLALLDYGLSDVPPEHSSRDAALRADPRGWPTVRRELVVRIDDCRVGAARGRSAITRHEESRAALIGIESINSQHNRFCRSEDGPRRTHPRLRHTSGCAVRPHP